MTRHLLHILPGFGAGGIQSVLCRVLNGLGGAYRHTILSLSDDLTAASWLDSDLNVEVMAVPGEVTSVGERRRLIAKLRPDLVLTANWGSMDWVIAHALWRRCPHLHQEHGFGIEEADAEIRRRVWVRRLVLRRVSGLVVPSFALEHLGRESWWLPASKILRIANGVDRLTLEQEGLADPDLELPCGMTCVVTVAPLRAEKRIDRLIRAFASAVKDRAAVLVIVGDGPVRSDLEQLSEKLGIADRVLFAGYRQQPASILARSDIYALSSDTEQLPASVLEAMALGLPVVATAVGDVPKMIAEANRDFAVDRDDEAALSAALARLIDDRLLRRALGDANRERQDQEYDVSTMVERYAKLYEGVMKER